MVYYCTLSENNEYWLQFVTNTVKKNIFKKNIFARAFNIITNNLINKLPPNLDKTDL